MIQDDLFSHRSPIYVYSILALVGVEEMVISEGTEGIINQGWFKIEQIIG